MGFSALRYSGAVKPARPGIASANRPRLGSFASLLDQILHDETALDGLAFAYTELAELERQALVRAVLQDAADPTEALAALLAVEEEPTAQRRLAGFISKHVHIERSAFLEGNESQGRARLLQILPRLRLQILPRLKPESLHITWNEGKINGIEVKSQFHSSSEARSPAVSVAEAVETLAPLLWQHIRTGGELPEGVQRFAGFFSLG